MIISSLVATFFVTSVSNAEVCKARVLNEREVQISVGSRDIHILGWTHMDDRGTSLLIQGIARVQRSARAGACREAVDHAHVVLSLLEADARGAQKMFDHLSVLHREKPLSAVAVELTPKELHRQEQILVDVEQTFDELEKLCQSALRGPVAALRMMAPGPEFEFRRRNSNVPIVAVEDEDLKESNRKDFAGEELDKFDFANPAITSEARAAIDSIREYIARQIFPPDSLIKKAISFEKDEARRAQLEEDIRFSISRGFRIIAGAYRRNIGIANELLNLEGNVAMPIGFKHVDHLVEEILEQCQRR